MEGRSMAGYLSDSVGNMAYGLLIMGLFVAPGHGHHNLFMAELFKKCIHENTNMMEFQIIL